MLSFCRLCTLFLPYSPSVCRLAVPCARICPIQGHPPHESLEGERIQKQLLKQSMINRRLREVQVSRHEVEQFYQSHSDSIPTQPEGLKLAHILLSFNPSSEVEDSVRELASQLRQQVLDGADFGSLSARHSSSGAGANGGDLGYVSREDMVDEFARAAFVLQPGDLSGVVRTQFGYHVVEVTSRS